MLILIVLGIFLEVWKCVECHVIFKCCPNDTKLSVDIYEDNNLAPSKIFSCVPNDKSVNETLLQFIGNNVVEDGAMHIPKCSDLSERTNDVLDTSLVFYGNSCVDILDNKYHVLSCDESTVQDNGTKIYKTRKCCPKNFAYDLFEQKCVDKTQDPNVSNYTHILGNTQSNVFEVGMPDCKENEVEVEYQSSVHTIIYANVTNQIVVVLPPGNHVNFLDENSYCLENTLSTNVATADGKISDEYYKENVLNSRKSSKFIVKSCESRNICDDIPCIRKCCKNGERFVFSGEEPKCEPHTKRLTPKLHFFNKTTSGTIFQPVEPPEFGILQEQTCEKYMLEPEDEHYFNTIDGTLLLAKENIVFDQNQYCVDYYLNVLDTSKQITEQDYKLTTFICFPTDYEAEIKYTLYAIAVSISAFFFGLTITVYMTFPKLLNLHGKTLLCYVISLFFAYCGLAIIQFNSILEEKFCKFLAFFIYFFFLAAFSWLNVLCFDIWLCFGSIRARGIGKKRDLKRFVLYSIYAWGIPSALTLLTYCMDQIELISPEWRPNLGTVGCWFVVNNSPGHLLFFQLPVGIQLCINLVLYVLTAVHCNKVKSEIHRMQVNDNRELTKKRFIADKAKFIMNTKLFIVMGVLWLLEILPSIYHDMPKYYSYIVDIFNLLQGVLVFLIFVFKRKVLVSFQKKLGMKTRNAKMSGPMSSNATTTSTNINVTALENSMQNGKNKARSDSNISTINMTNLKR